MEETFDCAYCDYKAKNLNTLSKHRIRKHPEHRVTIKSSTASPLLKPKVTDEQRLDKSIADKYRSILTNTKLKLIDDLDEMDAKHFEDLADNITSIINTQIIDDTFHVMCIDPDQLNSLSFIEKVMSVKCKCFCNLLTDNHDIEAHCEQVLSDITKWHQHCIVKFKRNIPTSTYQYHFNKIYGKHGYRIKRVNDLNHFINLWGYILRRQSSKNRLKTHLFQSEKAYLRMHQSKELAKAVKNRLPNDLQEDIESSQQMYINQFIKNRTKQTTIDDYYGNKTIGELVATGKIKMGNICKQYSVSLYYDVIWPERWSERVIW